MRKTVIVGYGLVGLAVLLANCSKNSSSGSTGAGAGGPHGPTDITVSWTVKDQPPATGCDSVTAGAQVHLKISGAIKVDLNQDQTVDCKVGTAVFKGVLVEDLGATPLLEGSYLQADGHAQDEVAVVFQPTVGATTITIGFFSATPTTTSTTVATSSTSGMGGMGGMGMGGAGGMSSTSTSTSSSTSTSTGMGGAGGAPSDAGAD
jgi:hypothetical protein